MWKKLIKWLLAIFIIAWFPARFYWDVNHYYTHFDDVTALLFWIYGIIACAVFIVRTIKKKEWITFALFGLALVSCAFFGYWIFQIPFCTECDHITRSDLGFMLEPFADRFGPYWPD